MLPRYRHTKCVKLPIRQKGRLNFLLCGRCGQALLPMCFFPGMLWALGSIAARGLAASWGAQTAPRPRPSLRAGAPPRPPLLSTSCDDTWQAWRRRPYLSDGCFAGPGRVTGRLHQPPGRSRTPHRPTAYAAWRSAPAGTPPVVRTRHRAMRTFRATATMPLRLQRLPPLPTRSRHQPLRARSG